MKKTNVVIDLSIEDYIKSYIEKSDSNKTKIYNKNKVERIGEKLEDIKSTGIFKNKKPEYISVKDLNNNKLVKFYKKYIFTNFLEIGENILKKPCGILD